MKGEAKRRRCILIRAMLVNAKDVPCMDCGRRYPTCVMELDHVRGTKRFELSDARATSASFETIRDEIMKCDVVCANCHRLRTFNGKHYLRNHAQPDDHPMLF